MYVRTVISLRHNSLSIAAHTKSKLKTISNLLTPSRQVRKNPQKKANPGTKELSEAVFLSCFGPLS